MDTVYKRSISDKSDGVQTAMTEADKHEHEELIEEKEDLEKADSEQTERQNILPSTDSLEADEALKQELEELEAAINPRKVEDAMLKEMAMPSGSRTSERRSDGDELIDDDAEGYFSPSPRRKQLIKNLENPIAAAKERAEHGEDDEEEQEAADDIPLESLGTKTLEYPPNSPPPYSTAADENQEQEGSAQKSDDEDKIVQRKPGEPVKLPPKAKGRGSLNELLMSKVAQPFQNMLRRASNRLESSSDEEGEDDLTNDELQLISFLDTFRPENIEIKPQLRPFLLEHMPAIGDIDCFVKIPRPDEVDDNVGLTYLDEPAINQSDKAIVDMQLRSATKEVTTEENAPVKKLSRADKNMEEIENWVASIKELHRSRPAQTVHYKGPMPEVEKLMQEWPQQFESQLGSVQLPAADLDVSTEEFVDICLNLVDIPVNKSRIQSLHLLFSLYNEFSNSQHFRNLAQGSLPDTTAEHMDRLEL